MKSATRQRAKLRGLIQELCRCEVDISWSGSKTPQEAEYAAEALQHARDAVNEELRLLFDRQKQTMTPSDVEVLMHCHFISGEHPRAHAPAVKSAIQKFLSAKLIRLRKGQPGYGTTKLGEQLVDMICRTPWSKF
jgi:hypothetical protein